MFILHLSSSGKMTHNFFFILCSGFGNIIFLAALVKMNLEVFSFFL